MRHGFDQAGDFRVEVEQGQAEQGAGLFSLLDQPPLALLAIAQQGVDGVGGFQQLAGLLLINGVVVDTFAARPQLIQPGE
ncbi:hypothetical protein D3C77_226670 [compost metagenome]